MGFQKWWCILLPQLAFKCPHAPRAKDHNIQVGWVCSPQVPKSPSDDLVSPVDVSRLHIAQAAGLCAGQQNQVSLGWGAGWEMTALYGGREGGDQWWGVGGQPCLRTPTQLPD